MKQTVDMSLRPDMIVAGRYRIQGIIGRGAMSVVFKAADIVEKDAAVALKLLYPRFSDDKNVFERFKNELLIARRLVHPNIVRVYTNGEAGRGLHFIVMEYVAGSTLAERLKDGERPLLFGEVLRILYQIALGLAFTHGGGVIHLDLKPENVLLTKRQEAKICDFGLACCKAGMLTEYQTAGTPWYMSPEQFVEGRKVDARSDIYSLGIMAFEMAAGRRPFEHEEYFQLAKMQIEAPLPKLSEILPGLPRWFEAFVEKCAKKDPKDRYPGMRKVADILQEQIVASGAQTVEEMRSSRPPESLKKTPSLMKLLNPFFSENYDEQDD